MTRTDPRPIVLESSSLPSPDPAPLTVDEMFDRLDPEPGRDVIDKEIIDDVYAIAEKQLAAEDAYAAKLDARATSLFGAVGFSMTLAFSFGGWALLDHASNVPLGKVIALAFVLVLAVGLITSFLALRGLLLRPGHKFVDEREVFHKQVIAKGKKRVDFRIHLATHQWRIWQQRSVRNQARAAMIRTAQRWFVGFLTAILLLSALTTASAITRRAPVATPAVSPP